MDAKYTLAQHVDNLLRTQPLDLGVSIEVTQISGLKTQVKVWGKDGAPRYFYVTVSEMM
jgi:hypothetical protein